MDQIEAKYKRESVHKMEPIRKVLLWEMIRYSPIIYFTLESVSKAVKSTLENDESYFQYFLEEIYGYKNIRSKSFSDCKILLEEKIKFNPPGVFHIRLAADDRIGAYEDTSGGYLSPSGMKDRNLSSDWIVLTRPGLNNAPWKIVPTGEADVYYMSQSTDSGWLSSLRWTPDDMRNDHSTYAMCDYQCNSHDRGIWKLTRGKGRYYVITYAHDDF